MVNTYLLLQCLNTHCAEVMGIVPGKFVGTNNLLKIKDKMLVNQFKVHVSSEIVLESVLNVF